MSTYFIPYPNTELETRWTDEFLEDCKKLGGRMKVLYTNPNGLHYKVERIWLKEEYNHWDIHLYPFDDPQRGNPRGYFVEDEILPETLFEIESDVCEDEYLI